MRLLNSSVLVLGLLGFAISPLSAEQYVLLGPSDGIALDQPRVAVEIYDPGPPRRSFGPELYNQFVLDTGANSILFAYPATFNLSSDYEVEPGVKYEEIGLTGSAEFDVSLEYDLDFAGTDGLRNTLSGTRVMSTMDESVIFGSFGGILGMPGMVGRVTSLDNTAIVSDFMMGVSFPGEVPADSGNRYSIPLTLVEFEQCGQQHPEDPTPAWAPLPYADASFHHDGTDVGSPLLLDTGAQMSVISTDIAFDLGLDADGDGNFDNEKLFDIDIGGLGGMTSAPVLMVDYLELPTEEGPGLRLTDMLVIVYDIHPDIPGLLGSEVLTSGWGAALLDGPNGYIEQAHLDFRNADAMVGELLLDLNPDVNVVVPEPTTAVLLAGAALCMLRRRRRTA